MKGLAPGAIGGIILGLFCPMDFAIFKIFGSRS